MSKDKILIVGTSGSGKTYLGNALAKKLDLSFTDLDNLYWLPKWSIRKEQEFTSLTQEQIDKDSWIICGNYSSIRDLLWEEAHTIIWLDFSVTSCLWQAFKRSIKLIIRKKTSCNGNYETLGRLFSRKSILLWIWSTHKRRRITYSKLFKIFYNQKELIRLTNRQAVNDYLRENH